MTVSRNRRRDNELLERILNSEEDEDSLNIIQEYWRERAQDCEDDLLNNRLDKAFKFLKQTRKYHEYKRRDGSIISQIRKEDGTVTTLEEEVHENIIRNLKLIQTCPMQPQYEDSLPFPCLPNLDEAEMEYITSKIYSGKAGAFDGITDILFNTVNKPITTQKLRDIWNAELRDHHFETRLIPLNKVHPEIPGPKDCRPVAVCSNLIKLIESRPRRELDTYMTERLHRGQTGFVPYMGITVNQMRLVQRVKQITKTKRHCFGLFIDFSSAYNTIYHTLLFNRLNGVINKDNIDLIKAIYSRTTIKLGNASFKPNIGVAQGSVISPALFNIYIEDLYKTLEIKADIAFQDLMGYADDLLIMCTSLHQLRKVIQVIRNWSVTNNLLLNEKKSGIMEFLPRTRTYSCLLRNGTRFESIPVVSEYKYLGLIVDQKLTVDKQLNHIEAKTSYQSITLWPVLKAFSLHERINLWHILVKPLFEMLIFLYHEERSVTNRDKVHLKIRKTFKKFCLLKKNVDNETVERLLNYNFEERAEFVAKVTEIKWEARKNHSAPSKKDYPENNQKNQKKQDILLPRELTDLLNLKTALCKKCNARCNSAHMANEHNILVPENLAILDILREKARKLTQAGAKNKKEIIQKLGDTLVPYIQLIKSILT